MTRSHLVLLANAFPWGNWEPYLADEIPHLLSFDHVDLFALSVRKTQAREIRGVSGENLAVHKIKYLPKWQYALLGLLALVNADFYKELLRLVQQRELRLARLIKILVFVSRANYEHRQIVKELKKRNVAANGESLVIYSYRMEYQAYLALLLKRSFPGAKIVLRGHRSDLYEELSPSGYIPFRPAAFEKADLLVPISEHGKQYLLERFPHLQEKIELWRLGTPDYGTSVFEAEEKLRAFSCSTITPVKRLDRLIDALSRIASMDVEWTHFGDGPLRSEIETLAKEKLPEARICFTGNLKHEDLISELKTKPFDLIVNTSDSEGVPVSIMEALSLGIPAVAVDAGGNKEIVHDQVSGFLITDRDDIQGIANALVTVKEAGPDLRVSARNFWEQHYQADKNYLRFVEMLRGL